MPLNWSTEKVKYFIENPTMLWVKIKNGYEEYEDVNPETKSLIFGSMVVCFGTIKESNISEWYARWKVCEKYDGFYLYSKYDGASYTKVLLTPDVLLKHINLTTNVSEMKTNDWCRKYVNNFYDKDNAPNVQQVKSLITVYKMEFDEIVSNYNEEVAIG